MYERKRRLVGDKEGKKEKSKKIKNRKKKEREI